MFDTIPVIPVVFVVMLRVTLRVMLVEGSVKFLVFVVMLRVTLRVMLVEGLVKFVVAFVKFRIVGRGEGLKGEGSDTWATYIGLNDAEITRYVEEERKRVIHTVTGSLWFSGAVQLNLGRVEFCIIPPEQLIIGFPGDKELTVFEQFVGQFVRFPENTAA